MNKMLMSKHQGFAMTLEVMATLFMITVMINLTLYNMRVMNVQRYFNTILTSTAAQASRWGGTNTKAYKANVSNVDLLTTARQQLIEVAPDYNPSIYGTPEKIRKDSDKITITINYRLPSVFSTYSKVHSLNGKPVEMYSSSTKSMSISINSVMGSGDLL